EARRRAARPDARARWHERRVSQEFWEDGKYELVNGRCERCGGGNECERGEAAPIAPLAPFALYVCSTLASEKPRSCARLIATIPAGTRRAFGSRFARSEEHTSELQSTVISY